MKQALHLICLLSVTETKTNYILNHFHKIKSLIEMHSTSSPPVLVLFLQESCTRPTCFIYSPMSTIPSTGSLSVPGTLSPSHFHSPSLSPSLSPPLTSSQYLLSSSPPPFPYISPSPSLYPCLFPLSLSPSLCLPLSHHFLPSIFLIISVAIER